MKTLVEINLTGLKPFKKKIAQMGYEIKGEDVLGHKLYITVENTWKSSPEEINRDLGSLKGVKIMTHVNPDYMDTEHKNIELLNM